MSIVFNSHVPPSEAHVYLVHKTCTLSMEISAKKVQGTKTLAKAF